VESLGGSNGLRVMPRLKVIPFLGGGMRKQQNSSGYLSLRLELNAKIGKLFDAFLFRHR